MKLSLLFFFVSLVLFPHSGILAQNVAPQSINSAGEKMTQSNGSLSFTVGELIVLSQMDALGNTLGGGVVHSAASSSEVTIVSAPNAELINVNVYPNPAADLLVIDIADTNVDWLHIEIYDMQGKLVTSEKHAGVNSKININTTAYPVGAYLLTLNDQKGKPLANYKLIKK